MTITRVVLASLFVLPVGLAANRCYADEYRTAVNSKVELSDIKVVRGHTVFKVANAYGKEVMIEATTVERSRIVSFCAPNRRNYCHFTGTGKYFSVMVDGKVGSALRLGDYR